MRTCFDLLYALFGLIVCCLKLLSTFINVENTSKFLRRNGSVMAQLFLYSFKAKVVNV